MSEETNKTAWGPIIVDMLKLIVVMGLLGALCKVVMLPFEATSPIETIVSLVRAGDSKTFDRELAKQTAQDADFINKADKEGRTPLMWAVYANYNDPARAEEKDAERGLFVQKMLALPGIKPDLTDLDGFNALHWAAWSGLPYCSSLLVKAGLDLNKPESAGYTPLMLAAMRGNDKVVKLLLELGADRDATNAEGATALQLAQSSGDAYSRCISHWFSALSYRIAKTLDPQAQPQDKTFFFTLIYAQDRTAAYENCVNLLQNPPAVKSLDELMNEEKQEADAAAEKAVTPAQSTEDAAAETAELESAESNTEGNPAES